MFAQAHPTSPSSTAEQTGGGTTIDGVSLGELLLLIDAYGVTIAAIVLTIVGIVILVRVWPFIRNAVRIVDTLVGLPTFAEKVEEKLGEHGEILERLDKEVHTNGGSSLRDAIVRIETNVGTVSKQVSTVSKGLADHLDASTVKWREVDEELSHKQNRD